MLSTIQIYLSNTPVEYRKDEGGERIAPLPKSYGRVLFSKIISERTQKHAVTAKDLATNVYGKPIDPRGFRSDFSISYSDEYTFVAVSDYGRVGIDVEDITPIDLPNYKLFCTPDEADYIHHSDNKVESFYEIWTLKEAYLKYLGEGLSYSLHSISFTVHPDKSVTYELLGTDTSRPQFTLIRWNTIQLALCHSAEQSSPTIDVIELTSIHDVETFDN